MSVQNGEEKPVSPLLPDTPIKPIEHPVPLPEKNTFPLSEIPRDMLEAMAAKRTSVTKLIEKIKGL